MRRHRYHRAVRKIETDYLVVGAGAAGIAFVDALIAASDADVVMVDRRHGPVATGMTRIPSCACTARRLCTGSTPGAWAAT